MVRTGLLVVCMVSLTVIANICLKEGARGLSVHDRFSSQLNLLTFAGLFCLAGAFVLYSYALRFLPLSLAQSLASAQFIGVILAGALVFGETIPPLRLAGIVMIAGGILCVALAKGGS